jgi:hypothetical protein
MLLVQSKLRIEEKEFPRDPIHPLLLRLCDYHEKNSIPRSKITRKRTRSRSVVTSTDEMEKVSSGNAIYYISWCSQRRGYPLF